MAEELRLPPAQAVGFFAAAQPLDPDAVGEALKRELHLLQESDLRLLAVSPLAGAGELAFAQRALDAGLPLILLLLKPAEKLAQDFPEEAREDLAEVLPQAAAVEVIHSSSEISSTIHLAQRLVDQLDVLIVLESGGRENSGGDVGAEMIAYATRRGRTVIRLAEAPGKSITRAVVAPEPSQTAAEGIESLCATLPPLPPEPVIPDEVIRYFTECDAEATKSAPQVRRYVLNIVLANALASMAGSVSSSFPHSDAVGNALTGVKFGAILLGLVIFGVLRHRQSQNHWLNLRLRAEICRSMMATWNSPRLIEPVTADEVPDMAGLIRSLHYLRVTQPWQNEITLEVFKAHYGVRRLADQYRYFDRQSESARRTSAWLTPLYWVFSGAALITSGAAILVQFFIQLGTWGNFFFVFVPIVTPILASWVLAWQAIESVSRKKIRFAEMKRLMQQALVDLVHCHSWEAVHHVVKRSEKVLLNEVLEWYSFVKLK